MERVVGDTIMVWQWISPSLMPRVHYTLLDMGTDFDFFGEEAHTDQEARLVKEGKITKEAQRNRQLLRSVMDRVGLRCYTREWWHFQEKIDMPEVRKRYKLLDF